MQRFAISAVAAAVLLGLGGCDTMSTRDKDTAIGAGIGAVGGAVPVGCRYCTNNSAISARAVGIVGVAIERVPAKQAIGINVRRDLCERINCKKHSYN